MRIHQGNGDGEFDPGEFTGEFIGVNSLEMNFSSTIYEVSGLLSPSKITLRLGLRFWFSIRVRIRVWRQFFSGAIVIEPICV